MGTPEGHQKSIFNIPKGKKTKIHMGSIRQNLQAQRKNIKFIKRTNQPIRTKIFLKNYVSSLKSVKEPKIRMGATRRSLQAQLKILKKLSEHQIYQSERKFSQKTMFRT
jgi:hypothetical protein